MWSSLELVLLVVLVVLLMMLLLLDLPFSSSMISSLLSLFETFSTSRLAILLHLKRKRLLSSHIISDTLFRFRRQWNKLSVKLCKETKGKKSLLPGQFSYELSEVCILGKCCIIVQLPPDALVSVLLGLLWAQPQLAALLSNTRGLEQVTSLKVVSYDCCDGGKWQGNERHLGPNEFTVYIMQAHPVCTASVNLTGDKRHELLFFSQSKEFGIVLILSRTFDTDGWITLRDQIIPRIVVNWPCYLLSECEADICPPACASLRCQLSPACEHSLESQRAHICEQGDLSSQQKISNKYV